MAGKPVKPVPDGYHTVTPYLVVKDVDRLLAFVREGLGGETFECHRAPDGRVMHAEAQIGSSRVMMGGANEKHPPTPGMLYLYVEDCDALYRRALAAGAVSVMEPADQFYGDRSGGVLDPCGNQWWFGTRKEEVSPEEMARRAAALGK
jgi:uncharacterized glyoxalase superfamily protein PhnB